MSDLKIDFTVADRFIKYVQIDTEADPESPSCPSTEKQKNLGKVLVEELLAMGVKDAEMDQHGYVYATIPSNTDKKVPVICYCSHMDTSPDCTGANVKPQVHRNWDGKTIVLPGDTSIQIDPEIHTALQGKKGEDIITTDGTTLLGADNKSGVAEIMDMAHFLMSHPEVKHGKIRILFTPDEEIGRGADLVDMEKLGADFGYTVDGSDLGSIEDESFSADMVTIDIQGVSIHPGYAKNKMEPALKIASDIVAALPRDQWSPETTSGYEGFVHPVDMKGGADTASITFIIRSFETEQLAEYEGKLESLVTAVMEKYPNSTYTFKVTEQYRNMKVILDQHPEVVKYAMDAIEESGMKIVKECIRGGTDGSRLSFMGLPCPNIFTGQHAYHSKMEWISIQDMQKSVETLIRLNQIWERNA